MTTHAQMRHGDPCPNDGMEGCGCRWCATGVRQRFGYAPFTDEEWARETATRWRNVVDRDVITLNADGQTGTSVRTGHVSAQNVRIVRYSEFWKPEPQPVMPARNEATR